MPHRCPPLALLLTAAATAQGWTPLAAPAWSYEFPPVVTDFARQRLVLVDTPGTTWEWDGGNWREVGSAVPNGSIVHHAGRARTMLMAFTTSSVFLEWDGHAWTPVPSAAPAPAAQQMAYDNARQRLVAIDHLNQLFEWDGAAWAGFGAAPGGSWGHLVYDSVRQRMLLLSHANINTPLVTHAWNGVAWQLLANTGPSNPHYGCADDPVRGRIVLHGGGAAGGSSETWEWDGSQWSLVQAGGPLSRRDHTLAFDPVRGQVLAFGGNAGTGNQSGTTTMQDAWAWSGAQWSRVATNAPPSRYLYAAHHDAGRDRFVLHGGRVAGTDVGDLWEFDGVRWEQRIVPGGPTPREGHAVTEAPGGGTLLFGGYDGQYRGDFWYWSGAAWTPLPVPSPSARAGHGMVFDSARNRVVLHGGSSAPLTPLSDTWEWDGAVWTQLATNGPTVFFGSLHMTYDPVAGGVLAHTAPIGATGTWLWNGAAWSNFAPALSGWLLGLGFDPVRGTTLAIVRSSSGLQLDTWMRTGASWTLLPGLVRPVRGPYDGSATSALAHARGRVLHYGGTYLSALPTDPAAANDVGLPCPDPAVTTPWLTSFGLPRIGDLGYRLALRAEPQRAGILGFATHPAPRSFGPGCDWHLDAGPQLLAVTDGAGLGELPMALPANQAFSGLDVFVQLATLEPNAALGFTFSAPVRLHLGD